MSVLPVHTVINCQRYRLIKHDPVFLKHPVVSSSIPKNVRIVDGPMTLEGATGSPSLLQTATALSSDVVQISKPGGPTNRKPSR